MANLLPDGSFELELWTLADGAEYALTNPLIGVQSLQLDYLGDGDDTATSAAFDVTADEVATIQFWVRNEAREANATIRLYHYPNGTGNPAVLIWSATGLGFASRQVYELFSADVTPTTAEDKLLFSGAHAGGFGGNVFNVDDVKYLQGADAVAVKLAERGVDAVVSALQTYLPTELTAIDTERADSITMAAPANANYYKRPKAEIAGATAHVEVYESGFDFANPYTDSGDSRAVYSLPVTVRLSYFNRDGGDRDEMVTRMRRYSAGVFNAISKNNSLGDSDDATQIAGVDSVTPPWESITEAQPGTFKGEITLQLTVKCEEVQT